MSVYLQTNQCMNLQNIAAYQLTPQDTGKIILLNAAVGQGVTVTLPALAAGLHYRFQSMVAGATLAHDVAIRGVAANNISGILTIVGADPVAKTGATSVTFTTAACAIGDAVELYCDGVQWSCLGYSSVAGGLA